MAYFAGVQEVVWLKRFLRDIGVVTHASDLASTHCDSMEAHAYTKDPRYHGKSKHIDVRYHFFQEVIA